jgi:hypothetical protein
MSNNRRLRRQYACADFRSGSDLKRHTGCTPVQIGDPWANHSRWDTGVQVTGLIAAPISARINPGPRRWIKPWFAAIADGATAVVEREGTLAPLETYELRLQFHTKNVHSDQKPSPAGLFLKCSGSIFGNGRSLIHRLGRDCH